MCVTGPGAGTCSSDGSSTTSPAKPKDSTVNFDLSSGSACRRGFRRPPAAASCRRRRNACWPTCRAAPRRSSPAAATSGSRARAARRAPAAARAARSARRRARARARHRGPGVGAQHDTATTAPAATIAAISNHTGQPLANTNSARCERGARVLEQQLEQRRLRILDLSARQACVWRGGKRSALGGNSTLTQSLAASVTIPPALRADKSLDKTPDRSPPRSPVGDRTVLAELTESRAGRLDPSAGTRGSSPPRARGTIRRRWQGRADDGVGASKAVSGRRRRRCSRSRPQATTSAALRPGRQRVPLRAHVLLRQRHGRGWRGGSWTVDYPEAEYHFTMGVGGSRRSTSASRAACCGHRRHDLRLPVAVRRRGRPLVLERRGSGTAARVSLARRLSDGRRLPWHLPVGGLHGLDAARVPRPALVEIPRARRGLPRALRPRPAHPDSRHRGAQRGRPTKRTG